MSFFTDKLINIILKLFCNFAVLDRTKEAGGVGEPLYLDICSALMGEGIKIVGGRYGLASKNTTPDQIYAVYCMLNSELKNNFTIGIEDDVTNLSLEKKDYHISLDAKEIKIFGFGSDGMVSASKDLLELSKYKKSIIVTDPKGEIYRKTSSYFRDIGYVVKVLNLNDMRHSDRWNPLQENENINDVQTSSNVIISNTQQHNKRR